MNKEHAQEWIKALRSGEYRQGRCKLYCSESGSYCCLGVLNKIMPNEYPKNPIGHNELKVTDKFETALGAVSGEEYWSLAAANDSGFYDFNQIADIIERRYKEL